VVPTQAPHFFPLSTFSLFWDDDLFIVFRILSYSFLHTRCLKCAFFIFSAFGLLTQPSYVWPPLSPPFFGPMPPNFAPSFPSIGLFFSPLSFPTDRLRVPMIEHSVPRNLFLFLASGFSLAKSEQSPLPFTSHLR